MGGSISLERADMFGHSRSMVWYDMVWYGTVRWGGMGCGMWDVEYDVMWYDMTWDMIYDMIWYDMIYDMWYDMIIIMIWLMWCDVMWYDTIRYEMIWYGAARCVWVWMWVWGVGLWICLQMQSPPTPVCRRECNLFIGSVNNLHHVVQ